MDIQLSTLSVLSASPQASSSGAAQLSNAAGETFHQALAKASSGSDQIASAATQFEALIASQVLKAVRDANQGGWLADDDDQTGELTLEMGEQAFAQALAERGAFGIAKMVTATLERGRSKTASSDAGTAGLPHKQGSEETH